jgi:hypothetical protein
METIPILPAWRNPEHGRDECCPYRRVLSLQSNELHPAAPIGWTKKEDVVYTVLCVTEVRSAC